MPPVVLKLFARQYTQLKLLIVYTYMVYKFKTSQKQNLHVHLTLKCYGTYLSSYYIVQHNFETRLKEIYTTCENI